VRKASQRWANSSKRSLDDQLQPSRDSGLIDSGHVLVVNDTVYNAVLSMSDVMQGTNSFYKLQVIELDKGNGWCVNNGTRSTVAFASGTAYRIQQYVDALARHRYLFRSWGRVGAPDIGGSKTERFGSREQAVSGVY